MKYFLLLPSLSYVGSSLDTGQWEQVLRSVAGARVYSWLNAGQIEARGIVEFLVLDDRFPRSLAFCRKALRENIAALARMHGAEGRCNALMHEADSSMAQLTVDQIFDAGLHEFLVDFLARNGALAQAIGAYSHVHDPQWVTRRRDRKLRRQLPRSASRTVRSATTLVASGRATLAGRSAPVGQACTQAPHDTHSEPRKLSDAIPAEILESNPRP